MASLSFGSPSLFLPLSSTSCQRLPGFGDTSGLLGLVCKLTRERHKKQCSSSVRPSFPTTCQIVKSLASARPCRRGRPSELLGLVRASGGSANELACQACQQPSNAVWPSGDRLIMHSGFGPSKTLELRWILGTWVGATRARQFG